MEKNMKEVPNIISSKDLLYIKDMINWNFIINKKIFTYLDFVDDEEIINILKKLIYMHKMHYKELLGILE